MRFAGTTEAMERMRSTMERQLTQFVRLVDELHDISRATRDKLELRRATAALRSVIAVETSGPKVVRPVAALYGRARH